MSEIKLTYFSDVKEGKLQRTVSQRIASDLKQFEGKRIEVNIEKKRSKRSVQQNRYYWVLVGILSDTTGFTRLVEIFKQKMTYFIAPGIMMPTIDTQDIVKAVKSVYPFDGTVFIKNRHREFCEPRQIIQYLMYKETNLTKTRIGQLTGGFNHATILNNIRIVENQIATNRKFRENIEKINSVLKK